MAVKILFITLSNIGDVIMTLPVLDCLNAKFPDGSITVLVGPRPKEIFEGNPAVNKVIVFDKKAPLADNIRLLYQLKKENFDVVVDLRNSLLGFLLPAGLKTSPFQFIPGKITHMKDRHLYRLTARSWKFQVKDFMGGYDSLCIRPRDAEYVGKLLEENGIRQGDKIIVVSPGARSHIKRWPQERFSQLISRLSEEFKVKVLLVGDKDDCPAAEYIAGDSVFQVTDLSGKTSIAQLACVLKQAQLLIANDSAITHLASYLNVPVVAIFGPTNEKKYGPWPEITAVVKKDIFCRPCEKAQCRYGDLKCMRYVKIEDLLRQVKHILVNRLSPHSVGRYAAHQQAGSKKDDFRRILIVRDDRLGDVLLSTPVITSLRDAYPCAYIAMIVSPCAKEAVEANPGLDEVLTYDKERRHRGWFSSIRFACSLRKMKFDLAVILHPTNRMHLITFLAGIKRRVGYNRKCGFLLTDALAHEKQLGTKHELEYALDLVRHLGIEPQDKRILMPIREESEKWVDELFNAEGIQATDTFLGIHPAASCPSKIWPPERFAEAADILAEKYGFKILVLSGPKDTKLARSVMDKLRHKGFDFSGKTSVSQLASLVKRCALFISNDSGPVHIASAVGVPVISIFGRAQQGVSPKRWGPVGIKDKVLHKEVGCIECLAHNCVKQFACLKAITVDDVVKAADEVLKG